MVFESIQEYFDIGSDSGNGVTKIWGKKQSLNVNIKCYTFDDENFT